MAQKRAGMSLRIESSPIIAAAFLAGILVFCGSCGYRVRSSAGALPSDAGSLGIPTFRNLTTNYGIEQLISRAVLKEFRERTRAAVTSSSSGADLILHGEIRSLNSVPVTFGGDTFGSSFLVTVRVGIRLVRARDSAVLWQNNDFPFQQRYMLNSTVRDFFSEENPALQRLAKELAESLAASVLDRQNP